jgi:hypothetical protein
MWKGIKVAAEICVDDFSMASIDQLVDVLYCVQCAAVSPIGVLFRLQIGLVKRVCRDQAPSMPYYRGSRKAGFVAAVSERALIVFAAPEVCLAQ